MGCTICTVKDILCPQTLELRKEKLAMMRKKTFNGEKKWWQWTHRGKHNWRPPGLSPDGWDLDAALDEQSWLG